MHMGPDWQGYVPVRVKSYRSAAMSGTTHFSSDFLEVPLAAGVLEIVGGRLGRQYASLWVGFSLAAVFPAPSFVLTEQQAVGSLVLPAILFNPWLTLLSRPAYFRTGGDGQGNAISSDLTLWG